MDVIGVIPARYGSQRFPGKPLTLIANKPLLQWVVERAKTSQLINEVIVATDDARIQELALSLNVKCVMTDSELPSGSDRVWQAIKQVKADIVVNIQGDEPLITGELLDTLVKPLKLDKSIEMATLGRKANLEDLKSPNTAKIIINQNSEALYFSRLQVPYGRSTPEDEVKGCLKHIGLYAYRKSFLKSFCEAGPAYIEQAEGLEQLRALYLGAKIKVVCVEHESWGVDTPEDVKKVEKLLLK